MPPLWQYFAREADRQTSPSRPPKGADHGPQAFSPANRKFLGTATGAIIAILDPWLADASMGGRRPCPRSGSTSRVCEKADESIAAPKGHGPTDLRLFPCKPTFLGDRRKGPSSPFWTPVSQRRDGGRRHAPVAAVLLAPSTRHSRRWRPRRARTPNHLDWFPLQAGSFLGVHEGSHDRVHGPRGAPT
jgi:hypothetical protein